MRILSARNPRYTKSDESEITLEIEHPSFGWIPFTARPDDLEKHGRELFEMAKNKNFGEVKEYEI